MIHVLARGLGALVLGLLALSAVAQTTVSFPVQTTQLVTSGSASVILYTSNVSPITPLIPPTFAVHEPQDVVVTLTDSKLPQPLATGTLIVTQANAVVGSAQLTGGTAQVALSGVYGVFTMYVTGTPGAQGVGTFTTCIALQATPSNCVQAGTTTGSITSSTGSAAGSITNPGNVSAINTLNISAADSYTFSLSDLQFPVALSTAPSGILYQGASIIASGITSGTTLNLSPGVYTLVTSAQASSTVNAGVYSVSLTGALGSVPVSLAIPVGTALTVKQYQNPSAQSVTLTVTDYHFPAPLVSAAALVTAGGIEGGTPGGAVVVTTSATGGQVTGSAPAGNLTVFGYGSAGSTSGTYSADITTGSTDLFTVAQGVGPNVYAFTTSAPLTAGAYQATAADLRYPTPLQGLSFAVAQAGTILMSSATASTVNFTATAVNAVVLVSALPPASGIGLLDVNVQSSGSSAGLILDQTQSVSSEPVLFNAQPLTLNGDITLNAVLTDLKIPSAFANSTLIISRGSQVITQGTDGATLTFSTTPGTYQLSVVASPPASQKTGLYGTSIALTPPNATFTASATSIATGGTVILTWTSEYATNCALQGGTLDTVVPITNTVQGIDVASSGSQSVTVPSTATYMLTCFGQNDLMVTKSLTVTTSVSTTAGGGGGGGGAIDLAWLLIGAGILISRRSGASPANTLM